MYDFLCLLPHGTGSVSFVHYLNLHKKMHVASFQWVAGREDLIEAHEKNFRPFFDHVGLSSKTYHKRLWVQNILNACSRQLLIQTTRDPVGCLVSQIYNAELIARIRSMLGLAYESQSIEHQISYAAKAYITHHRAACAYEAAGFDEHIVVDMSEFMPGRAGETLKKLWLTICGNADRECLVSEDYHVDIGSKYLRFLREYGTVKYQDVGIELELVPITEGDLATGKYLPTLNQYIGNEVCLHTFPDINEYLPAMQMSGQLRMCTTPAQWTSIYPKLRSKVAQKCILVFEENMRALNHVFLLLMRTKQFAVDDFTDAQRETLKELIAEDVTEFEKRHPAVVEKWTVTNDFMNS